MSEKFKHPKDGKLMSKSNESVKKKPLEAPLKAWGAQIPAVCGAAAPP